MDPGPFASIMREHMDCGRSCISAVSDQAKRRPCGALVPAEKAAAEDLQAYSDEIHVEASAPRSLER